MPGNGEVVDPHSWGVQPEYEDAAGRVVAAPTATVEACLQELGAPDGTEPPAAAPLILHPGDPVEAPIALLTEDGRELRIEGSVGKDVPLGYHTTEAGGSPRPLIVSPSRCHLPRRLRLGGWAVQVYAARSRASWGIGDLADVRQLGEWAAARGAGFALLSPLNATPLTPPIEASPYLPTSRLWRNPLYIRVEEVAGRDALGADLEPLAAAGRALNGERLIDRDAVAALKLAALERILATVGPGEGFAGWRREQGAALESFATFSAIAEQHGGDSRLWPRPLRDPSSAEVAATRAASAGRVTFHAWLQWVLDRQLTSASTALPLIADLPVGVDPGGAEVWADRDLFATGFSVGAPPDLFNRAGQDWAQPPWNPRRLRARGYQPLAAVLRAGFSQAMGLRIDHVMGLFRLFWIPRGATPADGTFVRFAAGEMLDILALESVRAGAVVVGEDLGTVEPVVRAEMAAREILSYRLLWFEEGKPSSFPRRALCAVTTHDLPTIAGLWSGADTDAQRQAGVVVNEAGTAELRGRLERVVPPGEVAVDEVVAAAYGALAASPSALVAAALEDAAQVVERPNMPGTTGARWPNWRLALPQPLDQLLASPLATRLAEILGRRPLSPRGGGGRGAAQS